MPKPDKTHPRWKTTAVKLDAETVARITAWRREQTDLPGPGAAVLRLALIGLDAEGIPALPVEDEEPVEEEPEVVA